VRTLTVRALDGISFHVRDARPSAWSANPACGKSTAGRAALRLIEPDAGEIIFKGENVVTASKARLRELRRKLQIIFQDSLCLAQSAPADRQGADRADARARHRARRSAKSTRAPSSPRSGSRTMR